MAARNMTWMDRSSLPTLPWMLRGSRQLCVVAGAIAAAVMGGSIVVSLLFSRAELQMGSAVAAGAIAAALSGLLVARIASRAAQQRDALNQRLAAIAESNERIRRTLELMRLAEQSSLHTQAMNSIGQSVARVESAVSAILDSTATPGNGASRGRHGYSPKLFRH